PPPTPGPAWPPPWRPRSRPPPAPPPARTTCPPREGLCARSGADVLVAAEHVGRVPGALEGDQAVVLGRAVGAADARLVELAQVVDVVDRGGEGAEGGHGVAAPGDPGRVLGRILPDGLGDQPEGGVAAAEGGGVLGDPAEGAAQRQQPDPAVGAGGLGQPGPDLV